MNELQRIAEEENNLARLRQTMQRAIDNDRQHRAAYVSVWMSVTALASSIGYDVDYLTGELTKNKQTK